MHLSTATPQLGRAKAVQRLFERDVPVEIVAPVLAHAALALAFDHALESENDPGRACRGFGAQCLGEVEVAGDLERRHLPGFRRRGLLVFEEGRYFLPKSVHVGKSCFE